jgi:hypothetical protein
VIFESCCLFGGKTILSDTIMTLEFAGKFDTPEIIICKRFLPKSVVILNSATYELYDYSSGKDQYYNAGIDYNETQKVLKCVVPLRIIVLDNGQSDSLHDLSKCVDVSLCTLPADIWTIVLSYLGGYVPILNFQRTCRALLNHLRSLDIWSNLEMRVEENPLKPSSLYDQLVLHSKFVAPHRMTRCRCISAFELLAMVNVFCPNLTHLIFEWDRVHLEYRDTPGMTTLPKLPKIVSMKFARLSHPPLEDLLLKYPTLTEYIESKDCGPRDNLDFAKYAGTLQNLQIFGCNVKNDFDSKRGEPYVPTILKNLTRFQLQFGRDLPWKRRLDLDGVTTFLNAQPSLQHIDLSVERTVPFHITSNSWRSLSLDDVILSPETTCLNPSIVSLRIGSRCKVESDRFWLQFVGLKYLNIEFEINALTLHSIFSLKNLESLNCFLKYESESSGGFVSESLTHLDFKIDYNSIDYNETKSTTCVLDIQSGSLTHFQCGFTRSGYNLEPRKWKNRNHKPVTMSFHLKCDQLRLFSLQSYFEPFNTRYGSTWVDHEKARAKFIEVQDLWIFSKKLKVLDLPSRIDVYGEVLLPEGFSIPEPITSDK